MEKESGAGALILLDKSLLFFNIIGSMHVSWRCEWELFLCKWTWLVTLRYRSLMLDVTDR